MPGPKKLQAPFFKAYGDYVNNFQNGVNTLLECKEKDRKFASFIDEVRTRARQRSNTLQRTRTRAPPRE